jgi:hypothetical protein
MHQQFVWGQAHPRLCRDIRALGFPRRSWGRMAGSGAKTVATVPSVLDRVETGRPAPPDVAPRRAGAGQIPGPFAASAGRPDWPVVRRVLVVLAWPLALLSGALVVVGVLAVLLMALGAEGDTPDCLCGDTGPRAADAIVQARVSSREGDDYLLDVERVERGQVADDPVVRTYGVQLRPWRRYRMWLFRARGRLNVSSEVAPQSLGLTFPAGLRAFAAVPDAARVGFVALPVLIVSTGILVGERGGWLRDVRG